MILIPGYFFFEQAAIGAKHQLAFEMIVVHLADRFAGEVADRTAHLSWSPRAADPRG